MRPTRPGGGAAGSTSAPARGTPSCAPARYGSTGCCASIRVRSAGRARSWTARRSTASSGSCSPIVVRAGRRVPRRICPGPRSSARSGPSRPGLLFLTLACPPRSAGTDPVLHRGCPHAQVPGLDKPSTTSSIAPANTQGSPYVANIKSQIKRIGTNEKARLRNKAVKTELKTHVRRVREAVAAGDKDAATTALATASKKLDKAVSKGVVHENQAANRKSALAKQVAGL